MRSLIPVILIFSLIQPCLSYRDPLVGRDSIISLADGVGAQAFDSISRQIANDPYNPGSFAWGWQYHARGCLIMFNLTGNRKWLDWAVNISDHFLAYSDVNGDGEPAWGNYNETWGNDRYDFREYTVWDGVIGLPIIETAKVILGNDALSDNETLRSKANAYVDLMERVVQRHHGSWNQVDTDQGYYWDDPYEDVGPIVNRFTALGRVELVLGDVTSNTSYYERPGQMANYMIANMRYDSDDDLYTWEYKYGEEGSEDISHGAIELEFLIMANQRGLLEDVHLERLANTYLKRIWQLPQILDGKKLLSMKVDGTDYPQYDYSSISRGWALLAPYSPEVFESQRIVFGVIHENRGMYASSVNLLGLAQIPLMAGSLEAQGTDPDSIRVVDLATIESMYDRALGRLNETMSLGSEAISVISLIDESAQHLNQNSLYNASIPVGLLYRAWEMLSRIEQTGLKLRDLVEGIEEAEELGVSLGELRTNLTIIQNSFSVAEKESGLYEIDMQIGNVSMVLEKLVAEALILRADEVVALARQEGIDTKRHEIFLWRAHEEFDKGNYGPAREFTKYPMSLLEEIPESCFIISIMGCLGIGTLGKSIFICSRKEYDRS